jgi:hypothetical protein
LNFFPVPPTFSEARQVVLARLPHPDTMPESPVALPACSKIPMGKMEQTLKSEIARLAKLGRRRASRDVERWRESRQAH